MGRSGAGKSTLLNLLHARLADRVALIPQAAALVKTLSVFHNVYMGRLDRYPTWYNLRNLVWPTRRDVEEIEGTLELVGLADKCSSGRERCPAASSNARPWHVRSTTIVRSSSATSRCRRSTGCKARMF